MQLCWRREISYFIVRKGMQFNLPTVDTPASIINNFPSIFSSKVIIAQYLLYLLNVIRRILIYKSKIMAMRNYPS